LKLLSKSSSRRVISWALYDWANSAFATTVMAGFFPAFFKTYWSADTPVSTSTYQLGTANALASLALALAAPFLGALADTSRSTKKFLLAFASLGISMTAALYFVSRGSWMLAAFCYILATVGFSGSTIFYDALLIHVSPKNKVDLVSALGYGFGYLGGGILFSLNIAMVLSPATFGIQTPEAAFRISFVLVAAWWALFSLPLIFFVPQPGVTPHRPEQRVTGQSFTELRHTLRDLRTMREPLLFLVAYFLYIDGVDTVIRMAVDYGMSIGFPRQAVLTALLITQFVGFPASILFGKLGSWIGARQGILFGLGVYLAVLGWSFFMDQVRDFYVLAVVIGLVQGGVQSLSRSFYTRLIPSDKSAQFFGFYNMWGKFGAIIGPALMGWTSLVTNNPRASILAVAVLFIGGAVLLSCVKSPEAVKNQE